MSITITGRRMTVTPALRRYLEERSERLKRYGVELDGCQFALSVEKYRQWPKVPSLSTDESFRARL